MPTSIRDICPTFLSFWEEARSKPRSEQKRLWLDLYEEPNRDVFDIYFSRYGHRANLDTALQKYGDIVDRIQHTASHITPLIQRSAPRCAALFKQQEYNLPFVLMVGVFNSDAWVTALKGQATTFLALEAETNHKLSSLEVTITHEIAHGLHAQCSALQMNSTKVGEGLFLEGLAVLVSTILAPGAPEVTYLCPGGECTLTGQDCQAWLDDCRNSQRYVCEQLLKDIERSDEERYAAYFWNREQTQRNGVPLRVGYVIGYELVKALYKQHPIANLAHWSPVKVMAEIRQQLHRFQQNGL